jgi:exodeoxyribonuclease-1
MQDHRIVGEFIMQDTMYWHDYETTGTDAARDRPVQFAGIRTDFELNVLSESPVLYSRLSDDVLPVPEAMLLTGIGPSELERRGVPENRFIGSILAEFSQPGTCVVGYNNLRFDDEFTRHALYRNLLDPYAREWQGGNSRWDIIDLVRMCYALRPEGIEWPLSEAGLPSFRLEKLTEANGINHEDAHDALADVRATIALGALIKNRQPRLFDFLFQLRKKQNVLSQLYPLGKAPVVHVSSMYPAARGCLAVVLPMAAHPNNTNGVIVYDLAIDPTPLMESSVEDIRHRLFTPANQLTEDQVRIPLKTIHINRCPAVAPLNALKPENYKRLEVDLENCLANMHRLRSASGVVEKIQDVFASVEMVPESDPDLMLYRGGFFSSADRQLMDLIVSSAPGGLRKLDPGFHDDRLEEMAFRYRARNYPETLDVNERKRWNEYRRVLWSGGQKINDYLDGLEILRLEDVGHHRNDLLNELRAWAEKIRQSIQ